MKIRALLRRLFARPQPLPLRAGRCVAPRADEEERPLGCGWFDSSHEHQTGLVVQEHSTPAALAAVLPLGSWIELQLAGGREARPVC